MNKVSRILFLILFISGLSSNSYAVAAYLDNCEYKYIAEYGKSVYVGTYKSAYGNYFTKTFDSYCPSSISI